MLRLRVLLAVAVVALGMVIVPGTEATPTAKRQASAATLPALKSAPLAKRVLARPVGRSSALVHGTRQAGFHATDVNQPPPATTAVSPDDGSVVTTVTPTLSVGAVTDPEGDAVSYRFKVTTRSDAESGTIVADTAVSSTSLVVPDGALKDGVTYFWHVYTIDGAHPSGTAPGWVRSLRVDLRLGQRATFPFDSVGPASVNLANGNLVVAASSASVSSLAGPVGVQLVYNSLTPAQPGLIGTYTADVNGNHAVDGGETPALVRRDPSIAFDWGTGSPSPGLPATNVIGRWVGFVTVPSAGSYEFGATTSDGVRITVGSTLVVDSWVTQAAGAPVYGSAVSLTGGSPAPITVEWFKGTTAGSVLKLYVKGPVAEQLVDPSWLTSEAGALPRGWALSPLGAGLSYVRAEVSDSRVVFVGPDGDTHVYASTGTGYTPPKDEDGVVARASSGLLTLDASDGVTYVFDAAGVLQSATSSSGAKSASLRYTWTTPSGLLLPRLTGITDPVSGRTVTLRYGGGGSCPGSAPSGFDTGAPTGMLCAVELWDGRVTKLWYVAGQLARIENPGAEVTDFAYDSSGRITKVRDPLAADLVAAGLRADDDTTRTLLGYDSGGRVSSVTLGAPSAAAARPGHSYDYTSATEVRTHVAGLTEPAGWARKVTMDANGRQLSDTDATGRTTSYVWDVADHVVATTDPAGLRSTTIFDWVGRPIESYGPGLAEWFGSDNKPLAAYLPRVAKTVTAYDEGMKGLDALYFDNGSFAGEPVGHELLGDGTGALHTSWTSPPSGVTGGVWSARFTGELVMDYAGSYTLAPTVTGRARVYLDDVLVLDTAASSSATYNNTAGRHRLRIEYTNQGPSWTTFAVTGAAQDVTVPAGVSSMTVDAWGGQGGASYLAYGEVGGLGGHAQATVAVTPGETLRVAVGGRGGDGVMSGPGGLGAFNGGGAGGSTRAGGGGGASDVRRGGSGLDDRVAVAAGGGGGGVGQDSLLGPPFGAGGAGGAGGQAAGGNGEAGAPSGAAGGVGGAAAGAGGSGGAGVTRSGGAGTAGSAGAGGAGGEGTLDGGGGGGGAVGGGGGGGGGTHESGEDGFYGGGGGGGGGSNWAAGTGVVLQPGVRSGEGQVKIGWITAWNPATVDLRWVLPGGAEERVPGGALTPRYGLVTSSVDADGKKATTEYAHPETGLATATVVDPAGLALRSTATYEAAGTGFFRATARTLPKGAATTVTYGYYGPTATRTNPCPAGGSASQAGMVQLSTDADPDGVGGDAAIEREVVRDDAGRVVASRVVGDSSWACTTFDARGRVVSSTDRSGGVTSIDHTTAGTVTVTFPDSAGAVRTTASVVDLLGRVVRSTDELGTETRTVFDQAGRAIGSYRTFSGQAEAQVTSATYDAAGRVLTQSDHLSGSARTVTYSYDAAGRSTGQARPNGVTTTSSYVPGSGRLAGLSHAVVGSTTTSSSQTFAATGAAQTWTVPAGVHAITVEAWGAQGGSSYGGVPYLAVTGGMGGYAKATIAVTPGETIQLNVGSRGANGSTCVNCGGQGGFNGGGGSVVGASNAGGGGGGASDVRRGGVTLIDRLVVAGGGGGGGSGSASTEPWGLGGAGGVGGSGSGAPGRDGGDGVTVALGGSGGAGAGAGGAGGFGYGRSGSSGAGGTLGQGGLGAEEVFQGGSGGGGWAGGGGGGGGGTYDNGVEGWHGGGGGGGGGSNFVSGTAPSTSAGVRAGDGQIVVAWTVSNAPSADYGYTLGGRVSREVTSSGGFRQRDFTYDAAGRLTTTAEGASTRRYAYDADTNRCGLAASCEPTAWVYDAADRITKSPYASAYTYDSHGNVTATTSSVTTTSQTFTYTGSAQTFTVPSGISDLTMEVWGAEGGGDISGAMAGAAGGYTKATAPVTAAEVLQVNVGGQGAGSVDGQAAGGAGGWNGGGHGGSQNQGSIRQAGAGGGGASDVRRGGTSLGDRVVVAGGGGGWAAANGSAPGLGGGATSAGGTGSGGVHGVGSGSPADNGSDGTLGSGGDAESPAAVTYYGGGGGGGGWYGGGSGGGQGSAPAYSGRGGGGNGQPTTTQAYGWGGGGGGFAVTGATGITGSNGTRAGNGQVKLTWASTPASQAIAYDANDHATVVNDGTTTVAETLAPSGRVLRRRVTINATSTVTEDVSFGYAGGSDAPAYSRPTAGGTVTTYLTGMGGLVDVGGTATWSLYNAHGDVLGTTNAAGAFTAAPPADEFGVGTTPASRLGWLGQQQRPSVGGSLGLFRMGVRLYDPRLGRFLQVDPVEGGSANDYDYVNQDPVNNYDLSGTFCIAGKNPNGSCRGSAPIKETVHALTCGSMWTGSCDKSAQTAQNTVKAATTAKSNISATTCISRLCGGVAVEFSGLRPIGAGALGGAGIKGSTVMWTPGAPGGFSGGTCVGPVVGPCGGVSVPNGSGSRVVPTFGFGTAGPQFSEMHYERFGLR